MIDTAAFSYATYVKK